MSIRNRQGRSYWPLALVALTSIASGAIPRDEAVSTLGALGESSSTLPRIASTSSTTADGDTLHVTWQDFSNAHWEILYSRSTDKGVTWAAPVVISSGSVTENCTRPQIATDGLETVYLTWHAYERDGQGGHDEFIMLAASGFNGTPGSFSGGVPINLWDATPLTPYATAPELCVDGNARAHVAWIQEDAATAQDKLFVFSVSPASVPFDIRLKRFDGLAFPKLPRIACDELGNAYVALLNADTLGEARKPLISHAFQPWISNSWTTPSEVPGDMPSGGVQPPRGNATELEIITGANNRVAVAWIENLFAFCYLNWSLNTAQTWATPVLVHDGTAFLSTEEGNAYGLELASVPGRIALCYGVTVGDPALDNMRSEQVGVLVDTSGSLDKQVIGSGPTNRAVLPETSFVASGGELHAVWTQPPGPGGFVLQIDELEDIHYAHWVPGGQWGSWIATDVLVNDDSGKARSSRAHVTVLPREGQESGAHIVFDDRRNFVPAPPISTGDGAPEIYHVAF